MRVLSSQYYRLPHVVIGGYDNVRDDNGEPVPLQFRLRQYREAELNISESRFILDGHVDELHCKNSVLTCHLGQLITLTFLQLTSPDSLSKMFLSSYSMYLRTQISISELEY